MPFSVDEMRCDKSLVCVATLIGLPLFVRAESSHAEKSASAVVTSDWQKGKKLAPETDKNYRLCAGTALHIRGMSQVEVQTKIPLPTSIDGLGPFAYAARLHQGRVDVAIDTKQKPANGVLIYGPRRTTVLASGGHVSVVVTDAGVAVGVYDGKEAAVSIGSTWKHITAGNLLVVSAEHPMGLEGKLPDVPGNVTVARPVIAVEGQSDPSRATWQKANGAAKYHVVLSEPGGSYRRDFVTADSSAKLEGLAPGRYELRVAALAAFDLDGQWSPPAYVNVVGVEMPPGGFLTGGRAFLEPGQQLKLTHTNGLEMTYDRATVYFKAVDKTGLRNGQSTTLHLRVPGSQERASLDVVPRALDTKVDISPATARWPRDKIRIQIQLPKAIATSMSVQLVPTVTVNSRPVELEWVRSEGTLETVVPAPPIYPGPWVLRAQVTDQHGYVLGRNFLEIASMVGSDEDALPVEVHRGADEAQARR